MDFTKLNIDFENIQNIIEKYGKINEEINNKIKIDIKEINKYETKIKNSTNNLEKECFNFIIEAKKEELIFLNNLLRKDEVSKNAKSV